MEKKQKIIIIISLIISAILIIAGVLCIIAGNQENDNKTGGNNQTQILEDGKSRLSLLIDQLENNPKYKITFTLNDNNYKTINKNGNQAQIIMADGGVRNTYTIKNNNTYLKVDGKSQEYEYKNNVSLLNDLENNLEMLLNKQYTVGNEKIENNNYTYEEYKNTSAFVINYKASIDESNTKTRFYFEGNNLKYIKTYIGDIEQLLKVEIEL